MTLSRFTTAALAAASIFVLSSTIANSQSGWRGMGMMGMGYGMMGSGCPGFGPGRMGAGPGRGMMGGGGMMHHRGYDADKADDLLEERLAELKKELEIGDKQEKAWKDYAEAVEDRFTTMQGMHQAMHNAMFEGNAIERMEVRIGMMENMLESMKAIVPAVKALYAVLPEDKKSKADSLLGGCGMM